MIDPSRSENEKQKRNARVGSAAAVTLGIRGKRYEATEEQAAEFNRLLAELKREIVEIPESAEPCNRLDYGYSEPYHTLTERYFDRMQAALENGQPSAEQEA